VKLYSTEVVRADCMKHGDGIVILS